MTDKHYLIHQIASDLLPGKSQAVPGAIRHNANLQLLSVVAQLVISVVLANSAYAKEPAYQPPPPDQYQPQPQSSSKFRPAVERRYMPAAEQSPATPASMPAVAPDIAPVRAPLRAPGRTAYPAATAKPTSASASVSTSVDDDTMSEQSDPSTQDLSEIDSTTQFTQIAQPQSTPALNVIVPAERPPIPTPPAVALPALARGETKSPESWRIKANSLFKTAPDKNKICQTIYSGNLGDAINSIVQGFRQQGYKIAEVNARSGHILIQLDNFARVSNGNGDYQERKDYTPPANSKERIIVAVRTNTPNQDCEIRAFVDARNKILTMDKVRQTLDQLRPAANSTNDEML